MKTRRRQIEPDDVLPGGRTVEDEIVARVMRAHLTGRLELSVDLLGHGGSPVCTVKTVGRPVDNNWIFEASTPVGQSCTITRYRYADPFSGNLKTNEFDRPYHLVMGDTFNFKLTLEVM